MENSKNKKSVKFQGDMLNFCDFIQVFVFSTNHHLKGERRDRQKRSEKTTLRSGQGLTLLVQLGQLKTGLDGK